MPRPSLLPEKRRELLPVVASAFAELGYRRTTTAELARRCGVQENILYRLWPDKKGMFIAAIGYVYESSLTLWKDLLGEKAGDVRTAAERLLEHEARHYGQYGHYRIVFAGLSETDDPDVRAALADMFQRYQKFVREQIAAHRQGDGDGEALDAGLAAWAFVGLGTLAGITRELGLINDTQRRRLFATVGRGLLAGGA
jgi:AcrR family transcriptional regulator